MTPLPRTCTKFVGLIRVSTGRQEESGLGLGAGREALETYCRATGTELVAVVEEVGSAGKNKIGDRPKLLEAIRLAKRHRACLLVPKIDRLVRSTEAATDIRRSGVGFRAADMPEANELTIDIMVAMAAHERRMISARTKAALAVYKRERRVSKRTREAYPAGVPADVVERTGGKLGAALTGSNLTPEQRALGAAKQRKKAVEAYAMLLPTIQRLRDAGATLQEIADHLNAEGHSTRNGADWVPVTVKRALDRQGKKLK
jgi:DNA invertase Pin-like site-specific DNA recombinase